MSDKRNYTSVEDSLEQQAQYRARCQYRRLGALVEEQSLSTGKWELKEKFPTINAAKRWSRQQAPGSVYAV